MATDPGVDQPAGRDETPLERLDRNWNDILQELRSVQTGTQIITGFLLATAFQPTFHDLDGYQLAFYLVLVALSSAATLLGLGPVILHRRLFGQAKKDRLVRTGNRLLLIDLVVVSLLAAGVAGFIFDVTLGRTAGFIGLAVAIAAAALLWAVVPRLPASD
ncbi:DUF6328 family protein [Agromyces neolithicus]|uniref:DUF6328 family protein n=1 Tax=Agromyces neolithicus TaxID=269420 RepID=A0ABP4Y5H9_9MICO